MSNSHSSTNGYHDSGAPPVESDLLLASSDDAPAASDGTIDAEAINSDVNVILRLQKIAGVVAHVLCVAGMAVVVVWVYMLGGLGWRPGRAALAFNWHPLLMTTAFLLMTVAALAFRHPVSSSDRRWTKFGQHALLWLVAGFCLVIGILCVFHSHDDPISGLIANLYSLHSWLGVLVMVLYFYQFTIGATTFTCNVRGPKQTQKAVTLRIHQALGSAIYLATAVTILVGIQEKEGFVNCRYRVVEVYILPQLDKIPVSCLASHTLAFIIVFITIFTLFALQRFA